MKYILRVQYFAAIKKEVELTNEVQCEFPRNYKLFLEMNYQMWAEWIKKLKYSFKNNFEKSLKKMYFVQRS